MQHNGKSRTPQARRAPRVPVEGGHRARTRDALKVGDWDNQPSTQSARSIRRPVVEN